ncbi:hypothetical protein V6N13_107053 [Hibiscus sabdariffa]
MTRSLPGLPSPPDDDNRNSKKSRHLDDEPPDSGGTREEPMDIDTLLRADNPHASHASHANIANPTSPATFKDMLMGSDKCGTYGHARDSCPSLVPTSVASPKMVLEQNHDPHPHPFDPYGPWMVVDRRQRRPQKNHATPAVCSLNKLLASSSKQHPQTRTPHAIIHLDRSKHSAIIFIDGPDSKLPATSSAPSISPPGPTEPLDNHFLPSSQPTGTKIPCDNASDLTDLLNCSMDH